MAERSPAQRARVLLEQESEMTLATIDDRGRPWVSPVFYALDDEHRLYWTSDVDARHSAALRTAAAVAIVVHGRLDGRTDAVEQAADHGADDAGQLPGGGVHGHRIGQRLRRHQVRRQ